MSDKLLPLLFSLVSAGLVRVAMGLTAGLLAVGALGEKREMTAEELAQAQAVAEQAAEVAADGDPVPANIAGALVLLLGVGFEWARSRLLKKGGAATQGEINVLARAVGLRPTREDGLPLGDTQATVREVSRRLSVRGPNVAGAAEGNGAPVGRRVSQNGFPH